MVATRDVTVAGEGPAGAATALQTVPSGHSVVLLEQSKFTIQRIGESFGPDFADETILPIVAAVPSVKTINPYVPPRLTNNVAS